MMRTLRHDWRLFFAALWGHKTPCSEVNLSETHHNDPDVGLHIRSTVTCAGCGILLNEFITYPDQPWR